MSIRLCDLVIAQEKSKIKAGEGKTKGDYKFFTSSNIQTKYVDFFQYDKPALIFGTGGIPSVHYCDEPFSTSTDCIVFYAKNNRYFLKSLYLFFESHMNLLEEGFHGAGLQHISKKYLLEIQMPDIPIEHQLKINDIVDRLNRLINIRKKQLENYDIIVKSRFIEMFGNCNKKCRLEKYTTLITKGASPKWQGIDYCSEGVLFITSENVREGYLDFAKRKYLPSKINEILPRSILKCGDILVNIVNASIGRAAIFDCEESANINQAVALVRVNQQLINIIFLLTFLNSDEARKSYNLMKVGGDKSNLSLKNISDLMVPVTDISFQIEFANLVKQVDKSKLAIEKSIEKLEILKKSLMQKYFG